jgi:hypothetical protein
VGEVKTRLGMQFVVFRAQRFTETPFVPLLNQFGFAGVFHADSISGLDASPLLETSRSRSAFCATNSHFGVIASSLFTALMLTKICYIYIPFGTSRPKGLFFEVTICYAMGEIRRSK